VPQRMIPTKDEDVERAKLPSLASELGFEFREEGRLSSISGRHENKSVTISVQRRPLESDILDIFVQAPASLVATIYHESWTTTGAKVLASVLSGLGIDVYCDLETGNEWIDKNFFIEVNAAHKSMMEALIAADGAVDLIEKILRRFDQISFTEKGIHFYRFIEKGDLDSDKVHGALDWLHKLAGYDGIFL
jgi:hypothetical protein